MAGVALAEAFLEHKGDRHAGLENVPLDLTQKGDRANVQNGKPGLAEWVATWGVEFTRRHRGNRRGAEEEPLFRRRTRPGRESDSI
jgi:hypothetical protein